MLHYIIITLEQQQELLISLFYSSNLKRAQKYSTTPSKSEFNSI